MKLRLRRPFGRSTDRESRRGWKRGGVCESAFPFGVCSVNVTAWQRSGTRQAPLTAIGELARFPLVGKGVGSWVVPRRVFDTSSLFFRGGGFFVIFPAPCERQNPKFV